MFSLDARLLMCASLVRDGARLADVGTDHAYLPVWLLEKGRISYAIATDINEKPLESGRRTAAQSGVSGIEFRLGAGLGTITADDGITDVVIAGMGGELIAGILSECALTRDERLNLILQPMTRSEELVRFLCENGYKIVLMRCVTSHGKTYAVINARYDGVVRPCTELYKYVGELDLSDGESRRFLQRIIRNIENKVRGDESLRPLLKKLKEL